MKVAIVLSLLAIVYLTVWNWRRFVRRARALSDRDAHIEDRASEFGKHRDRVLRARQEFVELTGADPAKDPRWDFVGTSYKKAVDALTWVAYNPYPEGENSIKFDQARYYMQYAADHAERVVDALRREKAASERQGTDVAASDAASASGSASRELSSGTAGGADDGESFVRDCVQSSVDRRG